MADSLFDCGTYQEYLSRRAGKIGTRQGHRSAMAKAMKCHSSYLTKVLNGEADISLEQAYRLNGYFLHSSDEAHFFLLLVQKARAGTKELRGYFEKQIEALLEKRVLIRERIQIKKSLSLENQAIYYSSWYYAAIHVALTIPELRTKVALASYFGLPISRVTEVLEFFVKVGLATELAGCFQVGKVQIHLGSQSPNISRHHANWKVQAIAALDREAKENLHYSSAVTLSRSDVSKIRNSLIETIQQTTRLISESKEEEVFCFSIDLFSLKSA